MGARIPSPYTHTHAHVSLRWVHYLVFDLLVGRGIVADAHANGIGIVGHWLFVVPCLFFTLMLGPSGFQAARSDLASSWGVEQKPRLCDWNQQ